MAGIVGQSPHETTMSHTVGGIPVSDLCLGERLAPSVDATPPGTIGQMTGGAGSGKPVPVARLDHTARSAPSASPGGALADNAASHRRRQRPGSPSAPDLKTYSESCPVDLRER